MTVQELLDTLRRSGVKVTVNGDRLRVAAPQGVVTPEIRRQLSERKPELIAELSRGPSWPAESREAERRFGTPEARLYPFLGKEVDTAVGSGWLLQVFPERVAVILHSCADEVTYLLPAEVRPPRSSGGLVHQDP